MSSAIKISKAQHSYRRLVNIIHTQVEKLSVRSLKNFLREKRRDLHYTCLRLSALLVSPVLKSRSPLRGYYSDIMQLRHHVANDYVSLDLSEQLDYCGVSLDQQIISPTCSSEDSIYSPETFVITIPQGRILYDYGVVVSPNHRLIAEVSPHLGGEPKYHDVLSKFCLPVCQRQLGRCAVVSSTAHQRYFHWMLDVLPRFELLQRSGIEVDFYIVNSQQKFQKDSLCILDIPTNKIIDPHSNTHIEAELLIVPSLPGKISYMTRRSCDFIRSVFLDSQASSKAERAIYITRSDALSRRVINESEILDELKNYGFEIFALEGMSILEQAKLFSQARVVVSPHGAGLTNLVFCNSDSSVIEFMPDTYNNQCFRRLASLRNLRYGCLAGKTIISHPSYQHSATKAHDHWVDSSQLKKMLVKAFDPIQ